MEKSKYIWLDGELVDWDSANVSVMTHTLHYGTGVFDLGDYEIGFGDLG